MITATFKWNGATVEVQKPTVATRVRVWQFRQALTDHGTGSVPRDVADTLCYYLANTVKVEGSLGFPVPLGSATADELLAFINGFADADESLINVWDKALYDLKYATNDPDLLPPEEVSQKKGKAAK
jgi:hypothetical protein